MTNKSIPVPCGRCPECHKRRVSTWSFRLNQEARHSQYSHFITLTYDTREVPITRAGFMSFNKSHCQNFFKRLRKRVTNTIRYYLVAEYGEISLRPHYHMLLFDCPDTLSIEREWIHGKIHVGQVNEASVGYCLKYMSKPKKIPMHRNDDRMQEFSLMSKGLGMQYLTPEMLAWHKADLLNRMYVNVGDGKKAAMPRYYKDRIYNEGERKLVATAQQFNIEKKEQLDRMYYEGDYDADLIQSHFAKFHKELKNLKKSML